MSFLIFLIPLFVLIFPLLLLPLETLYPYSYVIEELFKAVYIYIIVRFLDRNIRLTLTLSTTILFSISESLFYLINFISQGIIYMFLPRLVLTTFIHILTALVIFIPASRNRRYIWLGVLIAIILHYSYNQIVLNRF